MKLKPTDWFTYLMAAFLFSVWLLGGVAVLVLLGRAALGLDMACGVG